MKNTEIAQGTEGTGAPQKPRGKHKSLIKFLVIMLCSGAVGAVVGGLMAFVSDSAGPMGDAITAFLLAVLPIAQWVFFLIAALVDAALLFVARGMIRRYEKTGSTNDVLCDRADQLLAWGLILCSLGQILGYGLFGMNMALPKQIFSMLGSLALILLIMIYYTAYQVAAVAQTKRLHPEKKGDPLEMKFQKDWFKSCDEGERMIIYQASYQAFRLVNAAVLVLWVLVVLAGMFFPLGVLPVVIITVIWLVQAAGYLYYTLQLGKKKIER